MDGVVVLFLHLIPLCQNVEESYKEEFEREMQKRRPTYNESILSIIISISC